MSILDQPNLRAHIEQTVLEVLKNNNFLNPHSPDPDELKTQLFEAKRQLTLALAQRDTAEAECQRQKKVATNVGMIASSRLEFLRKLQGLINDHIDQNS